MQSIENKLMTEAEAPPGGADRQRVLDRLAAIVPSLHRDLPIAELEQLEDDAKGMLLSAMSGPPDPELALRIAATTRELGLIYKYKSYAAKCATPLGYSVFLQNAGEGFSLQRHITRKIEIFHIVETLPGAMVFLAPFDEWEHVYEPERFARWLAGAGRDAAFDRFRIDPMPGDVYVIDELNVVHTVLGCVLEEFATVSTDTVDRLHDQNEGRSIPTTFTRADVHARLRQVAYPAVSRFVDGGSRRAVERRVEAAETVLNFSSGRLFAQRRFVAARATTAFDEDLHRSRSLHVTRGDGRVEMESLAQADDRSRTLDISRGDVFMLPAGVRVRFESGNAGMDLSEQRVEAHDALSP